MSNVDSAFATLFFISLVVLIFGQIVGYFYRIEREQQKKKLSTKPHS